MEDEDESCGPEPTFVALAGLLDSAPTAAMEDGVSYQASSMTRRDVPSECGMKDLSTTHSKCYLVKQAATLESTLTVGR